MNSMMPENSCIGIVTCPALCRALLPHRRMAYHVAKPINSSADLQKAGLIARHVIFIFPASLQSVTASNFTFYNGTMTGTDSNDVLKGGYGSTMFDPSKSFDSIYKELELTELQADSLLNFRKAWRSLNRQSADIIWHVVCNDLDISGYEKMVKWREGY